MHIYKYIYIYVHIYTSIYKYVYTHTHTHTYIHIHINTRIHIHRDQCLNLFFLEQNLSLLYCNISLQLFWYLCRVHLPKPTSYSCTNLVVCPSNSVRKIAKKITVMAGRCGGLMSSNGRAWRICWSRGELMYRQKVKILKSQPYTVISRQKLIREEFTSELRACRLCWWKRELTNCPPKITPKSQKSALHSLFTF